MARETILVTGGCGFIGTNLCLRLLAKGARVRVLDDLSKGRSSPILNSQAEIVEGDVRDERLVLGAVKGSTCIIHLAAYGSVVDSVQDPATNFDVNVRGTFNVLNAAREQRVYRVILASTGGAAVGNHEGVVGENTPLRPISPYGAGKVAGEAYGNAYAEAYGMSVVALRFSNVYGPFSAHKNSAVVRFIRAVQTGAPITVYGDGKATRDYLHVDDLCAGLELAMSAPPGIGSLFHLASGVETSVNSLIQAILQITEKPRHPIVFHPARKGEVSRNVASFSLAERELGYRPRIGLKEGLRRTWEWFASL